MQLPRHVHEDSLHSCLYAMLSLNTSFSIYLHVHVTAFRKLFLHKKIFDRNMKRSHTLFFESGNALCKSSISKVSLHKRAFRCGDKGVCIIAYVYRFGIEMVLTLR